MTLIDWAVLASLLSLVLGLLVSAKTRANSLLHAFSRDCGIIVSASYILVMGLPKDPFLVRCFVFGVIAGIIIQPFLADPYLARKTLSYGSEYTWFTWKATPWWMALLWGIALTQLLYVWGRVSDYLPLGYSYILFVAFGASYFYIFEVMVNNFTSWWQRRNCWQPLKVAVYATAAETLTVAFLPFFGEVLKDGNLIQTLLLGIGAGIAIAVVFRTMCWLGYRPQKVSVPS